MKKQIFATIIICICALAMVDFSRAADPSIYIGWTYTNPPPDLAGFYLYVNDAQVQDFAVPTATSWSGLIILLDGNNTFEMAPYDGSGQEGKKCIAFMLIHDGPPGGELVIIDVHEN